MKRALVGLPSCLLVGGCACTESGDDASPAPPAARRIVYTKFLPGRLEVWVARLDDTGADPAGSGPFLGDVDVYVADAEGAASGS